MLAVDTFFSSQAMLAVVVALVGLAAFALGWLLLGTAARVKADRDMAARMAAIGRPAPQTTASPVGKAGSGWIPESVSAFGERFATSQGFAEKLDARLEAAGVSLRSGEFVVATVGAGIIGAVLGAAMLQNPLLAGVFGLLGLVLPTLVLRMSLNRRGDKMREQLPDVLTIMASSLRAGHSFLQALDTTARGDRRAGERGVPTTRGGDPAGSPGGGRARGAGRPRRQPGLPVGRPRGEHPARGRRKPRRDLGQRIRHPARARHDAPPDPRVDRRGPAVRLGPRDLAVRDRIYMFAVNPDYISLLFTTQIGLFMLGVAGVLMVLGILWMRKIVDIDV